MLPVKLLFLVKFNLFKLRVQRGLKSSFVWGVQRGAKALFGHGVEGRVKSPIVVVQGAKTLVSMKWRYPNGGRLVSRIEAGFKGAGRPIVRGQAAKGLCVSKTQRVGRRGLGRTKSPLLAQ